MFDIELNRSHTYSKPCIGVGNLSVGGTGKTPMIEFLIEILKDKQPVVLSRGYGRKTRGFFIADKNTVASIIGDEPAQIKSKYPEVSVAVSESRVKGLKSIEAMDLPHDLVLLDDAFQHRAIKPGLMILLTTFDKPFFSDFVLPHGRLREARKGYRRADIIVVTKCPEELSEFERLYWLEKINPFEYQKVFFATETYDFAARVGDCSDKRQLSDFKKIILLTGIASSQSLKEKLSNYGEIVNHFDFADHHNFSFKELEQVMAFANSLGESQVQILTTEKDLQRLKLLKNFEKFANFPVYAIRMRMEILFGENLAIQKEILNYVETNS